MRFNLNSRQKSQRLCQHPISASSLACSPTQFKALWLLSCSPFLPFLFVSLLIFLVFLLSLFPPLFFNIVKFKLDSTKLLKKSLFTAKWFQTNTFTFTLLSTLLRFQLRDSEGNSRQKKIRSYEFPVNFSPWPPKFLSFQ